MGFYKGKLAKNEPKVGNSEDPIFYTQKRPFSVILGAKKMGLWTPDSVFIGFLQGSEAGVTLDQLMKQLKATTDYFQE